MAVQVGVIAKTIPQMYSEHAIHRTHRKKKTDGMMCAASAFHKKASAANPMGTDETNRKAIYSPQNGAKNHADTLGHWPLFFVFTCTRNCFGPPRRKVNWFAHSLLSSYVVRFCTV